MGGLGGAALGGLVMLALQMLQRNGGLEGMMGRMQSQGRGREADSWVSTGENLPISPDVLSQILGREELGRAAQQMGLSPDEAAGGLAEIVPAGRQRDHAAGRVEPAGNDLVTRALEILQRRDAEPGGRCACPPAPIAPAARAGTPAVPGPALPT